MDVQTLHHRTIEHWADTVIAVRDDQWDRPTPCREWDVRALVNHVAGEDLWTAPLMRGSTIEEVGDRLDGDLLGDDPVGTALLAAREATEVVAETLSQRPTVHLSYGEEKSEEYLLQLAADHLVHAWDLAAATGGDTRLDPALVHAVAAWFAEREELYRSVGVVGQRAALTGDAQVDLLATFGRDDRWGPNHAALVQLSNVFGSGDVDAIMALMSADCAFESTGPAPDGVRSEGADAVRAVFADMFANTTQPRFVEEDLFCSGNRGFLRWRYEWKNDDGSDGHVRGVDIMRLDDGLITEKLSYVKG